MGGLSVTSGDSVSVRTESITAEAVRLAAAAHLIGGWAERAGAIGGRLASGQASPGPLLSRVGQSAEAASGRLRRAVVGAELASRGLVLAAAEYERAEELADVGRRLGTGLLGIMASTMLPGLAIGGGIVAASGWLGHRAVTLVHGQHAADAALAELIEAAGSGILSDPAFVDLVRGVADGADEFVAGLLGSGALFAVGAELDAPENARVLLAAAAIVGLATGAGTAVAAFGETGVRAERATAAGSPDGRHGATGAGPAPPPRGVGDLADRVPTGGDGSPQVRIERYGPPEERRWIVYSGGTRDFGVVPAGEPYDMTSNLHAVAAASALPSLSRRLPPSGSSARR
ncbi:hypothetical protein GCM10025870_18830 [Agromyces marinus]|uniref:Uncharacterized protein n=1 Tax=Agromyces marinus TaxID=1389020 RepID=A0ABN6YFI9_9MICO|nr:hypothetical protein GCM10025870_18830 [Agromyces marinus]